MKTARALALGILIAAGGCVPPAVPPAPDEVAMDRFEEGEASLAAGRLEEAASAFEFVLKYRSRWKDAYVQLAHCRELQCRDADALAVLEGLFRVDSYDEAGLRAAAPLYARQGQPARALDCYRRLRTLRPEDRSFDGEIARLEALRKP